MSALAHSTGRGPTVNEVIGGDWWEACRRADAKRVTGCQHEGADVLRARRLLDDRVSIERAWPVLNQGHRADAPQSTVEALVYELRTHGLAALNHPNCRRRLDDVSTAQLREVLARLIKLRPKYSIITDDLLLKLGGLL